MRWTDQVKAAVEVPIYVYSRKAAVREDWKWIAKRVTEK